MKQRRFKNGACLICDSVINRAGKPYCKIRKRFTEEIPEIKTLDDCPQRRVRWIEELPDL